MQEVLRLAVPTGYPHEEIPTQINAHLPDGLRVYECIPCRIKSKDSEAVQCTYVVTVRGHLFERPRIKWFWNQPQLQVQKPTKRKKRRFIDLKVMVKDLKFVSDQTIQVTLQTGRKGTVRPEEILRHIFQLPENKIRTARITKQSCEQVMNT